MLLKFLLVLLPWGLRRPLLVRWFGFELHPTSRIGRSFVFPGKLVLGPHASIGHLTMVKGLSRMELGERASVGNLCWISGFPAGTGSPHFAHQPERRAELFVGAHSAITHRHLIDCTARVEIGPFSTFAGFASQILTHSIDLVANRQSSEPVTVGAYCFVGTNCVLLGGARLPDRSVLGAKSLLNKAWEEPGQLYGGVPAKLVAPLPADAGYLTRQTGFVT